MTDKPHTEKQHVETFPGEPAPPEIVPHPIHSEPGAHVQSDDINVSMVALVGVFLAVLLFVIVVLLQAWFYSWNEQERLRKTEPSLALQSMRAEQEGQLSSYHWINRDRQVLAIPIDRAMDLVARDLATARPAPQKTGAP